MILQFLRRFSFLLAGLAIQATSLAKPGVWPIDSVKYIGGAGDSIYRLPVQYTNQCLSTAGNGFCAYWDLTTFDGTMTSYQATDKIVLEPGYTTTAGATLLLQIVPATFGVPQATNLTGNADVNINWIQSSAFDENGNLIGDTKRFYDDAGQPLQAQNKVFYRVNASTVYNHVLASQPILDAYGRAAVTTLPAPINYADFSYQPNFLQYNGGSTVYSHQNFDQYNNGSSSTDKTNSPDPLWTSGSLPAVGSLAWYYSPQNSWEPYTPVTAYPYTRQTWYQDGTGNVKKSAAAGESVRMGTGHENSSYTTPVVNELADYIRVRNYFFTSSDLGAMSTNLQAQAIQTVSQDGNGQEAVVIEDRAGNLLMSARPGTDLVPTPNTVTLNATPFSLTVPATASGSGCSLGSQLVTIYGSGSTFILTNPAGQVLTLTGPMNGYTMNFSATDWGTVVQSDQPFNLVYPDQQGSPCTQIPVQVNSQTSTPKEYYFKILANNTAVSLSGNYTLYDMSTEATTSLLTGNLLNQGFYKVVANTGTVTLTYGNSFADVSYNFYNQKGQMVATVSPEGVKRLYGSGINNYAATKTAMPLTTLYSYDQRGRLIGSQDPDEGSGLIEYRNDGKIRFSQNATQQANGSFSYTNYDALGRPIESGQYQPDANGITYANTASILENITATGGLTTGTKTDVVTTQYDVADNSYYTNTSSGGLANYVQDPVYLGAAASVTRRYSSIVNNSPSSTNMVSATWYNYDADGRLTWKIQYIAGMGSGIGDAASYKTVDYTYDPMDNLIKKVYQANTAAETFVHYFDYDPANSQLWHVYTNTVDNTSTRMLQATYYYYLHGGVKRVELGTKLQGTDYTYTLQGALKAINNSNKAQDPGGDGPSTNGFGIDAFGEVLDYFSGDYVNGRANIPVIVGVNTSTIAPDSYAGNIKAMSWYSEKPVSTGASDAPNAYVYQYDPKYQLTNSIWGTALNFSSTPATFNTTAINQETVGNAAASIPAYDENGNIQSLQRTDANGNPADQFSYRYGTNSNQLASVVNTANSQPFATFSYDATGAITGITGGTTPQYLTYDVTGKVTGVYQDAGHTIPIAGFVYDENGERIKKLSYSSTGQLTEITFYTGEAIYTQTISNGSYLAVTPQEYPIIGMTRLGTYYTQGPIYAYEMKDHLGNVRAVIAQNAGTMQVRAYSDYYPFGYVIVQGGTNYRYGYQGETAEFDGETSWNAFELRMYNSRIARWLGTDPAGEFWSPYEAMGNDPADQTDPDGGSTDDWMKDITTGQYVYDANVHSQADINSIYGANSDYTYAGASVFADVPGWNGTNNHFLGLPDGAYWLYGSDFELIQTGKALTPAVVTHARPAAAAPPAPPAAAPPGEMTAAQLANAILQSRRVQFASTHPAPLKGYSANDNANADDNINDAAAGRPTFTSPYGHAKGAQVYVSRTILSAIWRLSQQYTFTVSEITGGRHSGPKSKHYLGLATDVTVINGVAVTAANPHFKAFMQSAHAMGAFVLGPGAPGHGTHVHFQFSH